MNKSPLTRSPLIMIFLLCSFLILFTISNFQTKKLEGFTVINDKLVPLADIQAVSYTFKMHDSTTGNGIPNVCITVVSPQPFYTPPPDVVYTDANGYATLETFQSESSHITAEHLDYEMREVIMNTLSSSNIYSVTIDWELTPKGGVPPSEEKVKVEFYVQADELRDYYTFGKLAVEGTSYEFSDEPQPRVVLWLFKSRGYTMTATGKYYSRWNAGNPTSFTYVVTVETGSVDATFWLDVLTGDLHTGKPPVPPTPVPSPWDVWAWIMRYGWILLAGAVTLYALPHVASLAKTIRGR